MNAWRGSAPTRYGARSGGIGANGDILVLVTTLFFAALPLGTCSLLPESVRVVLISSRIVVGLSLCAIVGLVALTTAQRGRDMFARPRRIAVGSSLMLLLLLSILIPFKNELSVPVLALYGLYACLAFLIVPRLVTQRGAAEKILRGMVIGSGVAIVVSIYLALTNPGAGSSYHRTVVGYANPHIFAQVIQVFVVAWVGGTMLENRRQRSVRFVLVWTVIGLIAANLVTSRSTQMFFLSLTVFFWLLRSTRAPGPVVLWVLIFLAWTSYALLDVYGFDRVDRVSSGRLTFWGFLLEATFQEEGRSALFLGPFAPPNPRDLIASFDDIGAARVYARSHWDNVYLDLFVDGGLLGLVLFMAPFVATVGAAIHRGQAEGTGRREFFVALMIAIAVEAMFTSLAPSFGNPVGAALPFWIAICLFAPMGEFGRPTTPQLHSVAPLAGARGREPSNVRPRAPWASGNARPSTMPSGPQPHDGSSVPDRPSQGDSSS